MPSFTGTVPNLVDVGPLIEILISPSRAYIEALHASHEGAAIVTSAIRATAMIDTGASGTVVNPRVISTLGLSAVGSVAIHTPSTTQPIDCDQFHVDISFPNAVSFTNAVVICAPLGMQNIECLIGRDILENAVLTYIGYINQFTISF
ncbi:MAG: aspartyl protease family protein [Thermoanaerobaculia bacterium]